jgi:hypothetical protein
MSVIYQVSGTNTATTDGMLVVLGGFYTEPVYTAAYGATTYDINTRLAALPSADTTAGVGIINLATVPAASGLGSTTYRIGTQTVDLTAAAGVPVRFRKLYIDDTFFTGSGNFSSTPTVGQYAIVDHTTGQWKASASDPGSGLVAAVISSGALTQGVDASVTQYFMRIVRLA